MKHYVFGVGVAAGIAGLLAAGRPAEAQPMVHNRVEIEVHGDVAWGWDSGYGGGGVGAGLRVDIPLMSHGPIRSINNSLALGIGADVLFWTSEFDRGIANGTTLIVPVMLQWNFYITPLFSLFPELGVAVDTGGCYGCTIGVVPGLAVGGRIHFNNDGSLPAFTFRLGFPTGLTLGVSF